MADTKNQNKRAAGNHPDLYANIARMGSTQTEFEITFGLTSPTYDGVKPVANIRLHPFFAKSLLLGLQEQIEKYEERFGSIPLSKKGPEDAPMQ